LKMKGRHCVSPHHFSDFNEDQHWPKLPEEENHVAL